jgi:hypothetical protein
MGNHELAVARNHQIELDYPYSEIGSFTECPDGIFREKRAGTPVSLYFEAHRKKKGA